MWKGVDQVKQPRLQQIRVKNFKAIRDSGVIKFTPLTVFIGNNGSGKSSLVEALETYQQMVTQGLDVAMQRWRGFENVCNRAVSHAGRTYNDLIDAEKIVVAMPDLTKIKRCQIFRRFIQKVADIQL